VLGIDPQRGDVISVQSMTFDDGRAPEIPPTMLTKFRQGALEYASVVRYGAMAFLFAVVYALMFRPAQKQIAVTMRELAASKAQGEPALASPLESLEPTGVTSGAASAELASPVLKRQLAELVQAEPVAMTRTVQAWLREDPA